MSSPRARGPRRRVVEARVDEATTGLLSSRRRLKRWWELRLECGHIVERPVRYTDVPSRHVHGGRAAADLLPAPAHVWCEECARTNDP